MPVTPAASIYGAEVGPRALKKYTKKILVWGGWKIGESVKSLKLNSQSPNCQITNSHTEDKLDLHRHPYRHWRRLALPDESPPPAALIASSSRPRRGASESTTRDVRATCRSSSQRT